MVAVSVCCAALSVLLPHSVIYSNNSEFGTVLQDYWSQQEVHITPSCIVTPSSTLDVQVAVATLSNLNCKFAVKGGGHTPIPGSANIDGGVTIALQNLNQTTLSSGNSLVTIGAGQQWGNVFTELEPLGLAVAGGRTSSMGIGGFTTGGGTFYFAPLTGFACDNVEAFEVVLANGSVVNATATKNSDLFVALKGGSNNFGVITSFTFRTFPLGNIWAGDVIYPMSTLEDNVQAFVNFSGAPNFDQNASLMQTYGYSAGASAVVNALVYAQPVVNPPSLQIFTDIQPQYESTMAITTLPAAAAGLDASAPSGSYQILTSVSIINDAPTLLKAAELWNATVPTVENIDGIVWTITVQPINNAVLSKQVAPGNSLGLPSSTPSGSFIIVELAATWSDSSDTTFMTNQANYLMGNITAAAKSAGTLNRWIDLNHATAGQKPIAAYGPQSVANLQAVSKKYDPRGVFQTLVPGGFKLSD